MGCSPKQYSDAETFTRIEPEATRPELYSVEHVYSQDGDTMEGVPQSLTIRAEDGGAGHFLIISTERWAFEIEQIDEFIELIRKVARTVEPGENKGGSDDHRPHH